MQFTIDLNADLGEMPDNESVQRDIDILSVVSSCNIACGGHAGDEQSMRTMVRHAKRNGVRIGAHPSYPDKEGFGRRRMDISYNDLQYSIRKQIKALMAIADQENARISYIKPHGALYNDCADDRALSSLLADTIYEINPNFAIMGLPNSYSEKEAHKRSFAYIAEAFIDRRYTNNSRLQNRNIDGAVISDIMLQKEQALALALGKEIQAETSKILIHAHSLCLHSDSPGALSNAQKVREYLNQNDIAIGPR